LKAFILAAGEGTRMRPLTANIAKPLLPVAGRPFLEHSLLALREHGIQEMTLLVGWQGNRVRSYFGNGESLFLRLHYEEQERREGTAQAVSFAKPTMEGPFFCVNGDVVVRPSTIGGMLKVHREQGGSVVALARVEDPTPYGVAEIEGTHLVHIEEKPAKAATNLVNAGIYLFEDSIFREIEKTPRSPRGEYELTEAINRLAKVEKVSTFLIEDGWLDVSHPWDLLEANEILMKDLVARQEGEVEEGVRIKGPVLVRKGAVIRSGAYLEGPLYIGEGSEIGPNCYLRPSSFVGRGCKVGAATEVKNSILMDGAHAPHHNYVGDSILGERVNLGSGTKIANLRLDEANVRVELKGRLTDTKRRKFGAIIGDDTKVGINASIDVGTIIGENSKLGPGVIARGVLAPGTRLF